MTVRLAITPDGKWSYPTGELVSAASTAGISALGISADRVDAAAALAYHSAGLDCHEVLALVFGDDETETMRTAEHLAKAAETIGAAWVLTVFTTLVTTERTNTLRRCASLFTDAGAGMAVEFSPLGPVGSIPEAMKVVRAAQDGGRAGLLIDSWHFFFGPSTFDDLAAVPLEDIAYVQFTDALAPESERLVREAASPRAARRRRARARPVRHRAARPRMGRCCQRRGAQRRASGTARRRTRAPHSRQRRAVLALELDGDR